MQGTWRLFGLECSTRGGSQAYRANFPMCSSIWTVRQKKPRLAGSQESLGWKKYSQVFGKREQASTLVDETEKMFQITTQDLELLYQYHGKTLLPPLPQANVGPLSEQFSGWCTGRTGRVRELIEVASTNDGWRLHEWILRLSVEITLRCILCLVPEFPEGLNSSCSY